MVVLRRAALHATPVPIDGAAALKGEDLPESLWLAVEGQIGIYPPSQPPSRTLTPHSSHNTA